MTEREGRRSLCQELLGRFRNPKGRVSQLECSSTSSAHATEGCLWDSGQRHQLTQARSSWCQAPSATCPAQEVLPSLAPAAPGYTVTAAVGDLTLRDGAGHPCTGVPFPSSFLGPGGLSVFPSPSPTGPCPEQSPSASLCAQPSLWDLVEAHLPAFPGLPFSLEVRGLLGAVPSVCIPPPLTGPEGNFPVTHSAGTSCGHQGRGWGDPVGWLCILGSLGEGDYVSRPLKGGIP